MRALVAKTLAALALPAVGLLAVPAVADAAPASDGAALCVSGDADYTAVLQWPNRDGFETRVVTPGNCSTWGWNDPGELIVVLADYNGATINLGHFIGNGGQQVAVANGRVGAGTEHFSVLG